MHAGKLIVVFSAIVIGTWPAPASAQSSDNAGGRLSQIESRLLLIQDALKNLTGRLERSEFERSKLTARVEQLEGELAALRNSAPTAGLRDQPTEATTGPATVEGRNANDAGVAQNTPASNPEPDNQSEATSENATLKPLSTDNASGTAQPVAKKPTPILGTISQNATLGSGHAQSTTEPTTPGSLYNAGISHLERGEWQAAIGRLEQFGERYSDHELANNANYWLAESLFYNGDYLKAAAQFSKNYQAVGQTGPRAEENLLKIGLSLAEAGDLAKACQMFDQLEQIYPSLANPIKQALVRGRATSGC